MSRHTSPPKMIDGYLVVGRRSGMVRAFRRDLVQAFEVHDRYASGQVYVLMVRIPASHEDIYRRAESSSHDGPVTGGTFVAVMTRGKT